MKSGIELICEERLRVIAEEGYDAAHDAGHVNGELAGAGACYALWHAGYIGQFCWRLAMSLWPFEEEWWNPAAGNDARENRVRDLVKAGQLIAAEIDRVQAQENRPRIIVAED